MCKKVAQLTRVIFYLNTKNDDYENNLKAVVNAYENELDNTIKEVSLSQSRPIILLENIKKQQTKPTKTQNQNNRLKKFKITSKEKNKNHIKSSNATKGTAKKEKPSKPLKPVVK